MSKRIFTTGLTRYWWIPLVTGLIFVAFGIWCFVNPASSIEVMAYCFCAGMLAAGVLDISFSIANRRVNPNWGWWFESNWGNHKKITPFGEFLFLKICSNTFNIL